MTGIRWEPGRPALTAMGHAGAGEKGRDLVCAALSAMFLGLCAALEDAGEDYAMQSEAESARLRIDCRGCSPRGRLLIRGTAAGLRTLAAAHPEHVRFEEAGRR